MQNLEEFVSRINDFNTISSADKIPYFAYYLTTDTKSDHFFSRDIHQCFESLHLKPYSNIGAFLLSKTKGKNHIFLKKNLGYAIERKTSEAISAKLGISNSIEPSNNYFPGILFNQTRGYVQKISTQALSCYDYGLYDACFIMTRKLLETLIIELFEKKKIESKIKNPQGQYFFLSDLLGILLSEKSWTLSRNTSQGITKIKKIADVSAHNRRFCAIKSDVDGIKLDLRIVLEELLHLIDYLNWK